MIYKMCIIFIFLNIPAVNLLRITPHVSESPIDILLFLFRLQTI